MKQALTTLFSLLLFSNAWAIHICTMTFNSSEEKLALQQVYQSDPSAEFTELVPEGNDANWLQTACKKRVRCDILLVSGHFGGLFFGEKTLPTLSTTEMLRKSCQNTCPGIFDTPRAVYLMGCNTLASKKADHRRIEDYLKVLVQDGFPLENAEMVAAARYSKFGDSIEERMRIIFPHANLIFGFDSTGPRGLTAGPLLKRAFLNTPPEVRSTLGASANSLNIAFKGFNARINVTSKQPNQKRNLLCSVTSDAPSVNAVQTLFSKGRIREHFDAALEITSPEVLENHLERHAEVRSEFLNTSMEIIKQSASMPGLQQKIYSLLLKLNIIDFESYKSKIDSVLTRSLSTGLDYIKTEQLCDLAERSPEINLNSAWALPQPGIESFRGLVSSCFQNPRGKAFQGFKLGQNSSLWGCLSNPLMAGQEWYCLTTAGSALDVGSCLVAAQRNPDPGNSDNMRWYCWDRLREQKRISQSECLALSKSMNILGNRIKSNWNCLNSIY